MKYAIYGVLLSALLAGCAQEPAKTGDKTAADKAAQTAGAQTSGMSVNGVDGSLLTGKYTAPPKNVTGPLATRVIYFDYDSSAIRSEFQNVIAAHATFTKANPKAKLNLQGHADERGSRAYNVALGQRRSDSVNKAMGVLGVAGGQMEAVSFGEEKPAVEGHDEAAWSKNRRVEIRYDGEN